MVNFEKTISFSNSPICKPSVNVINFAASFAGRRPLRPRCVSSAPPLAMSAACRGRKTAAWRRSEENEQTAPPDAWTRAIRCCSSRGNALLGRSFSRRKGIALLGGRCCSAFLLSACSCLRDYPWFASAHHLDDVSLRGACQCLGVVTAIVLLGCILRRHT